MDQNKFTKVRQKCLKQSHKNTLYTKRQKRGKKNPKQSHKTQDGTQYCTIQ